MPRPVPPQLSHAPPKLPRTHLCSFRSCSSSVILAINDLCSFLICWNFCTISSPSLLVSVLAFLSAMFVVLSATRTWTPVPSWLGLAPSGSGRLTLGMGLVPWEMAPTLKMFGHRGFERESSAVGSGFWKEQHLRSCARVCESGKLASGTAMRHAVPQTGGDVLEGLYAYTYIQLYMCVYPCV